MNAIERLTEIVREAEEISRRLRVWYGDKDLSEIWEEIEKERERLQGLRVLAGWAKRILNLNDQGDVKGIAAEIGDFQNERREFLGDNDNDTEKEDQKG